MGVAALKPTIGVMPGVKPPGVCASNKMRQYLYFVLINASEWYFGSSKSHFRGVGAPAQRRVSYQRDRTFFYLYFCTKVSTFVLVQQVYLCNGCFIPARPNLLLAHDRGGSNSRSLTSHRRLVPPVAPRSAGADRWRRRIPPIYIHSERERERERESERASERGREGERERERERV
jgi:hypothetical protein